MRTGNFASPSRLRPIKLSAPFKSQAVAAFPRSSAANRPGIGKKPHPMLGFSGVAAQRGGPVSSTSNA